jgi:hypothetical protein
MSFLAKAGIQVVIKHCVAITLTLLRMHRLIRCAHSDCLIDWIPAIANDDSGGVQKLVLIIEWVMVAGSEVQSHSFYTLTLQS